MQPLVYLLVGVGAMIAGILAQFAGGGAALILIPTLIFLGVDPRVAIGSAKVTGIGNISSVVQYIRKRRVNWEYVPFFLVASIIAAVTGASFLMSIESDTSEKIFGVLVTLLLPFILFNRGWGLDEATESPPLWKRRVGILLYLFISIIQAAFSAGGGIVQTYVIVTFFGYPLLMANATRHIAMVTQNVLVFTLYAFGGLVDFGIAVPILIGSLIGNYIGANIAIKRGSAFMKIFFVTLVAISAFRLLFL